MGRTKIDKNLSYRSNRLTLKPRKAPYWTALAEGEHLGYYRPASKAAGTWQAKWRDKTTGERKWITIGTADDYEDADGARIWDCGQAQTKAIELFDQLAREARRRADGGSVHEGPYTVSVAIDDYMAECRRQGLRGLREQGYRIEAHIRPTLGDTPVAALTRRQLSKWMDDMSVSPRRRVSPKRKQDDGRPQPRPRNFKVPRPPKPEPEPPQPPRTEKEKRARRDSANRVYAILKAALNHAVSSNAYHGEAVWNEIKLYKNTKSARTRFLSIEDQVRFARATPPDFQRLVKGALFTGARYGELTKVTVSDYSREAQALRIPGYIAKSGKDRNIYLTPEGQDFFDEVTAGRPGPDLIFQRDGAVKRVTRAEGGNAWLAGDQRTKMIEACIASGIGALTFHELRHTAASTWIAAGLDLVLVASQLGHSDTRMVEKHYGHFCPTGAAARFRSIAPTLGLNEKTKVAKMKIKTS